MWQPADIPPEKIQRVGSAHNSLNLGPGGPSHDRYKFAEAIRSGWIIDPETKRLGVAACRSAIEWENAQEKPNMRRVKSAMAVINAEQALAVKDLHHLERMEGIRLERAEEYKRLDEGKLTERVEVSPAEPIDYDAVRAQMRAEMRAAQARN